MIYVLRLAGIFLPRMHGFLFQKSYTPSAFLLKTKILIPFLSHFPKNQHDIYIELD